MDMEGTYLNIVKAIYDKPTASILKGEKLKAFPIRSETIPGCPILPLFNTVLEVLATAVKRRKRNKRNADWKRGSKALTVCR